MKDNGLAARFGGLIVDKLFDLPRTAAPYEIRRDLAVPMTDGVSLLGDLYRPKKANGALPTVLIRLPYGRAGAFGMLFGATLARQGLQLFIQSTRGTFGSGGQFRPFTAEHDDGMDTLTWVRDQPWCDGRVAMTGGSYFGHTQWAIAPYADPALESISPHITAARITSAFYTNGAPGLANALNWTASIGHQETSGLLSALPNPVAKARMRRAMSRLPLQAADVAVAGAPVAFWRDFVEHAAPSDPFWEGADHSKVDMSSLPPMNMVTGWWDLFVASQLDDFRALRAAGNDARIVVGPWLHGEPGEFKEILKGDVTWLNHHLNGGPAPVGGPVRVILQRTDTWLDFAEWPPPHLVPVALHLRVDRSLSLEPESEPTTPARFTYDPADPTPSVGGPMLQAPGKQADNRPVEQRSDVLIFTGPELTADVDVVGPVGARIFLRTEVPYADLFVRLCDVGPDGESLNVVDGIRRLEPSTVPADDVEIGPDDVLAVDIELFPTAYRFKAGHRMRMQISGGAFPRYARNMGTGESFGVATSGVPCGFAIYCDNEHPSVLKFGKLE